MRDMAVFTMQQDEPAFLPVWLRYYTRAFEPQDVFVLDHWVPATMNMTPQICARYGGNYFPVNNAQSFDHRWMLEIVKGFQRFLLLNYHSVLFAEVDELVVCKTGPLRDFIERNAEPVVRPMGLNVFHEPGESALNFGAPILAQRRFGYVAPSYSKPLLGREPIEWSIGFHGATKMPTVSSELIDCHLHRADFQYCLERHRRAGQRKFSEYDRNNGLGVQYYDNDPKSVAAWFYGGFDLGVEKIEIPAEIKGAF